MYGSTMQATWSWATRTASSTATFWIFSHGTQSSTGARLVPIWKARKVKMRQRTKMGQRREANADSSSAFYQERRQSIVDAAARVFQERGFEATSIGEIAEKLKTDRASIYYYFGSKQELFPEIVREAA